MEDHTIVAAAALAAVLAIAAPPVPVVLCVGLVIAAGLSRRPVLLAVALAVLVGARAHASIAELEAPLPDRVEGIAQLAGDPERGWFGTRAVVRIDGRRWVADIASSEEAVVRDLLTGDHVELRGTPRELEGAPPSWVRSRHLAGRLAVQEVGRGPPAAPWYRIANEVHRRLAAGASSFDDGARALYMGLVVGDDRQQDELTEWRFRASGLTHLLAVSGQNVAFLLVVCRPLLERMGLRQRLVVAGVVLSLFVLVTRAEPSVLRATAMTAVALWASTYGRWVSPTRAVALAVMGLLLVDPLLVHSTGFRLSVAATAGLVVLSEPLAERLPGPRWLTEPLSVTLAAQMATAPILLAFTDGLPVVAVVANLAAGPAAGAVMVLGVTVGLVAGFVRADLAQVLQLPARVLVWWVDTVASASSHVPLLPLGGSRMPILTAAAAALVWAGRVPAGRSMRIAIRLVAAVVLVPVALALVPPRPQPGIHHVDRSTTVRVWPCGAPTVEVRGTSVGRTIDALRAAGVDHAAVVAGDSRAVAAVAEQLGARVVGPTEAREPPCRLRP